jgi:hypothetical protein
MISDQELIRLAYPATESVRRYSVSFSDGSTTYFAVETQREARRVGTEYGVRFRNGARIVGIERVQ